MGKKLLDQEKSSLIKQKQWTCMEAKKKQRLILFLSTDVQLLPWKQGFSSGCSRRRTQKHSKTNASSSSPLFFQILPLSRHHTAWNIPVVSLSQLSWLCPLPRSCPPQPTSEGGVLDRWFQRCSAGTKALVQYQHLASYQCNTQHRHGENYLHLARLSTTIRLLGFKKIVDKKFLSNIVFALRTFVSN